MDAESFLEDMHQLIQAGRKHFVRRNRHGISYIQMLADLGITSIEEAWECVLQLTSNDLHAGPEEDDREGSGSPLVVWVCKKEINSCITYIKSLALHKSF